MTDNSQTGVYLIYVDESYDNTHFAYSALFIDAFNWNLYFSQLLDWRKTWFEKHQIPPDYELHATDFVGGRGKYPQNRDRVYRASLFHEAIGYIEKMKGVWVINAITADKKKHLELFERVLNRINRTLGAKNFIGVLICDEGNENKLISIVRRMQKKNMVPSCASLGYEPRDIPLKYVIEDPLFKTSQSSYFIQLADFLAFSLLRNEKPLPGTLEPVKTAFDQLDKRLVKEAFGKDPKRKGIVRI